MPLQDSLKHGYPPGLDEQHTQLFELCDRLKLYALAPYDVGFSDSGLRRAITTAAAPTDVYRRADPKALEITSELIVYTINHFEWEDAIMEATAATIEAKGDELMITEYAAHVQTHMREHAALRSHSLFYRHELENHAVTTLSLYVFVKHWLIAHVGKTDRALSYWCRMADGLPQVDPLA